jgi:hypothetical protein
MSPSPETAPKRLPMDGKTPTDTPRAPPKRVPMDGKTPTHMHLSNRAWGMLASAGESATLLRAATDFVTVPAALSLLWPLSTGEKKVAATKAPLASLLTMFIIASLKLFAFPRVPATPGLGTQGPPTLCWRRRKACVAFSKEQGKTFIVCRKAEPPALRFRNNGRR